MTGIGGTCGTYRGEVMCMQGLCWGKMRERDHFEDLATDLRIILKWVYREQDVKPLLLC
jgi:hypothetical protein